MHYDSGWSRFFILYALTAFGFWFGLGRGRRGLSILRFLALLVTALPLTFVVALATVITSEIARRVFHFQRLPGPVDALLALTLITAFAAVAGRILSARFPTDTLQRGTVLVEAKARRVRSARQDGRLAFAGQPLALEDETKHFKAIGTTGTGKSTVIRELLTGALARGDRAVIADPDGSYRQRFYDASRGDVILNPFSEGAHRWDLFAEVLQPHDADSLARSLIPDYEGSDRNWRGYARTFLSAILRQLHRAREQDPARLYYLLVLADAGELRELLEATPAAPFLAADNTKFFESVRSVAAVHLGGIEHVAAQTTGELLSVRQWIREGRGVLFLPYRASEIDVLRHLVSAWMRLAIFQTMDSPSDADQRLWFVVDELDALGAIDGLKDALARLRKFGGRCVLGFQSIAQVRGTYGDAEAQTIVENCGNTLILRCSASERGGTSEFASRLIGTREIIRRQVTRSRAALFSGSQASESVSEQHVTEEAVMASEIEQLPDLAGFLKLASRPEWMRVVLSS